MATVNKHLLKSIRNGTGKTQKQVAEEVGVHVMQYSRYERGVETPGLVIAQKIAKSLDTPLDVIAEFFNKD